MEKKDVISIIIPVYNVEKFVRQSIESVLNQTYQNLEIIVVDDGSKDLSGKICDEYALKDKRMKVLHKKNGGLSSARNVGMDNATGAYLMFLDSDDFLEKNACEVLLHNIKAENVDYVIGNYTYTTYQGEDWSKPMFNEKANFEVTIKNYAKSFFVMNSVVWNKMYKTASIRKNNLKFVEGALAEDAIFTSYYYTHTQKGYFVKDIIYHYRQNDENKSISTKCDMTFFEKLNDAYKQIYNNYKNTDNIEFYRFFCARIMPWFLCKIIASNYLENEQELIEVLSIFQWYFKQKEEYSIEILNEQLNEIINLLNAQCLTEAVTKIKEVRAFRETLNNEQKSEMFAITDELYERMSKDK